MLLGLFDKNYEGEPLSEIYNSASKTLETIGDQGEMEYLFTYHLQLVKTLAKKWNMGIRLKNAYDAKDITRLQNLAKELGEIATDMEKTYQLFADIWLKDNKPFGLEVADRQFSGTIARCYRAKHRVEDFIAGGIQKIDEFEEEKLYYTNQTVNHDLPMVYEANFDAITTVQ